MVGFRSTIDAAAADACDHARRILPQLDDEDVWSDDVQALLRSANSLDPSVFEGVRGMVARAHRAQRRLDGKRARLRGMVRHNHIEVSQIVAALVGERGALVLPKLTTQQMLRGKNKASSTLRESFAAFQALMLHNKVLQEVEHRNARCICGRAASEFGSTSRCMVLSCRAWGRANGRVFACAACGSCVSRDGQGT